MNRMKLLGAAGLAASLMAAPAFAATDATTAAAPSAPATTSATPAPDSAAASGIYPTVGQGGYTADQQYIQNGNNNNNRTANNAADSNLRPSQRNADLADNGSARASKVIGTAVYNTDNQKLGSVDDILLGKSGIFAVISTNQKKVAVPFDQLKFGDANNDGNNKLVLPNETQAKLNTQLELHYDESNYQSWKASHKNDNGVAGNNNGWHGNAVAPLGTNHNANNNHG